MSSCVEHDPHVEPQGVGVTDDLVHPLRGCRGDRQEYQVGAGLLGDLAQRPPRAEYPYAADAQVALGPVVVEDRDRLEGGVPVVLHEADRLGAAGARSQDYGAPRPTPLGAASQRDVLAEEPARSQVQRERHRAGDDRTAHRDEGEEVVVLRQRRHHGEDCRDEQVREEQLGDLVDRSESCPAPKEEDVEDHLESDGEQRRDTDGRAGRRHRAGLDVEHRDDRQGQHPHGGVQGGRRAVGQVQAGAADIGHRP